MPKPAFPRIGITTRHDMEGKEKILARILEVAKNCGCEMTELQDVRNPDTLKNIDLLITLGGDGTVIATVRELPGLVIPLLCINQGTLGFLTEMESSEIETALPTLLMKGGILDERQLLQISLQEGNSWKPVGRVLNEAVVGQGGFSRLLALHTLINGEELATFRADGLILATPTGSTAYNLAAGGTIVHPRLTTAATILTPINPHSFRQKPLVVPGAERITVEVLTEDNAYRSIDPVLTLDGQITIPLKRGQRVSVIAHEERVKFLRRKADTFYQKLREKLGWGE